jgi:hypothetical protein
MFVSIHLAGDPLHFDIFGPEFDEVILYIFEEKIVQHLAAQLVKFCRVL